MIQPVARIHPLIKLGKVERDKHKFTALPPEISVDKSKKETWTELLSPWLIVGGFVLAVALLNRLIGG